MSGGLSRDARVHPGLNTRGLFAAARFESAQARTVRIDLAGEVKQVWVNGLSAKAGAQFSGEARRGENVVVLLLDDLNLPAKIRLSSTDVSFFGSR